MAETLGSLVDKLSIVKLKQWHSTDPFRLASLSEQEIDLQKEINEYVSDAYLGRIPTHRLLSFSNKVYKKEGNEVSEITGSLGGVIARLVEANCQIWHEQERAYDFESVPQEQKNKVVRNLAKFNLERNFCIDEINRQFVTVVTPN